MYQSSVISAQAETAVAPPWFNDAMKAAIADGLKPLEQKVEQLEKQMDQVKAELDHAKEELRENWHTTNQTYNMQCDTGEFRPYKIVRFIDGTSPLNDYQLRALYTVQDIRGLNAREVKIYLEGYGIPSYSDNPKQDIASVIGCLVVV